MLLSVLNYFHVMGQAEGVYNARLQNVALTLNKVIVFCYNM